MLYQQRVIQEVVNRLPTVGRCFIQVTPPAARRHALRVILNRALRGPLERDELDFFRGKTLNLSVTDLVFDVGISLHGDELKVTSPKAGADVKLAAISRDLLLIAAQEVDVDRLFFQRRLQMSGDTQLGLGIKNLLAGQDINEMVPRHLVKPFRKFTAAMALSGQK